MSLLIIRLSSLVCSGTMMKYASLTKDNDGEGLRVSVFQKASWIESQKSRLKRLSRRYGLIPIRFVGMGGQIPKSNLFC